MVGSDKRVQLLDIKNGRRLAQFAFPVTSGSTKLFVCGDVLVAHDLQTVRAYELDSGAARWVLPKLTGERHRRAVAAGPAGTFLEVVPPMKESADRMFGVLHLRDAKTARVLWSWSPLRPNTHRDFHGRVTVAAIDAEHTLITAWWGVLD